VDALQYTGEFIREPTGPLSFTRRRGERTGTDALAFAGRQSGDRKASVPTRAWEPGKTHSYFTNNTSQPQET